MSFLHSSSYGYEVPIVDKKNSGSRQESDTQSLTSFSDSSSLKPDEGAIEEWCVGSIVPGLLPSSTYAPLDLRGACCSEEQDMDASSVQSGSASDASVAEHTSSEMSDLDGGGCSSLGSSDTSYSSIPAVDALLCVPSLEAEASVVKALQETSRLCWSEAGRHLFCGSSLDDNKGLTNDVEAGSKLQKLEKTFSCHVYRFLYGFVYETQPDLHQYVTDQVLSQCVGCVMNYHRARRQLLRSMSVVFDISSITSLDAEYLRWDLQRITAAFRKGVSWLSSNQGRALEHRNASSSPMIDLTSDDQPSEYDSSTAEKVLLCAIVELFAESERFCSSEVPKGLEDLQKTLDHCIQHLASLPFVTSSIVNSLASYEQRFFASLIHTSVHSSRALRRLGEQCLRNVLEYFRNDEKEKYHQTGAWLRQALKTSCRRWKRILSRRTVLQTSNSVSKQLPAPCSDDAPSPSVQRAQLLIRIYRVVFAVKKFCCDTQSSTPFLFLLPLICSAVDALASLCEEGHEVVGNLLVPLFGWCQLAEIGFLLSKQLQRVLRCLLRCCGDQNAQHSRIDALRAMVVFLDCLCSQDVAFREDTQQDAKAWSALLLEAFKVFSENVKQELLPSHFGLRNVCRDETDALCFGALLWVLAFDAQISTPSHTPIRLTPSEAAGFDEVDGVKSLSLQQPNRVLPLLQELCRAEKWEEKAPSEFFRRYPITRVMTKTLGALFDWALADFKYEVNALFAASIVAADAHRQNTPLTLQLASVVPRAKKVIECFPFFVEKQLIMSTVAAESVTALVLRHLADVSTVHQYFVDFPSSNVILAKYKSLEITWSSCSGVLDLYQRCAALVLQNILDRLKLFSPNCDQKLPLVNSLCCTNRTPTIHALETWEVPLLESTDFCQQHIDVASPLLQHCVRFLSVLLSGRLSLIVLLRLKQISRLLLPNPVSDSSLSACPKSLDLAGICNGSWYERRHSVLLRLATGFFNHTKFAPWAAQFVESLDIAFDVLFEKIEFQRLGRQVVTPSSLQLSADATLPLWSSWTHWMVLFLHILPGLERYYGSLLQKILSSSDACGLTSLYNVFASAWKAVTVLVEPPFHTLSAAVENRTENSNGALELQLPGLTLKYDVCLYRINASLILEFLQSWVAAAVRMMENVVRFEIKELALLLSLPEVHISAFGKHTVWTAGVVEWCIAFQEAELVGYLRELSKTRRLKPSDASSVWARWRATPSASRIQTLCTDIAKGLTLVHRHFKHQTVEKGSYAIPLLARGEQSLSVTKRLAQFINPVTVSEPTAPVVVDLTSSEGSIEASRLPAERNVDEALIKEKAILEAPSNPETVSTQSGGPCLKWSFLPKPLGNSNHHFGFKRKQNLGMTSFLHRGSKTFPNKLVKTSRVPESLRKKLGDDGCFPRLKLRRPQRTIPRDAFALHSRKLVSTSSDNKPFANAKPRRSPPRLDSALPTAQTTKLKCTVLASSPVVNLTTKRDNAIAVSSTLVADPMRGGQRLSANTKALFLERATAKVQDILHTILEWDFFQLSDVVIPGLRAVAKQLPLTFENEEDFRKSFQPLVLEECRCSIVQSGLEKRLEGFPVRITRSTRLGNNTLITTAKSDRRISTENVPNQTLNPTPGMQETTIPDRCLESIPLQPWDLVMLVPKEGADDGVEGRTFAELRDAPDHGYWIGIVEKDDEVDKVRSSESTRRIVSVKLRMPFRQSPAIAKQLRRIPATRVAINSSWVSYVLGSLTTSVREIQALFMSHFSALFPFILNPSRFGVKPRDASTVSTDNHTGSPGSNRLALQEMEEKRSNFVLWEAGPAADEIQKACGLNGSQLAALHHALTNSHRVALLQGPPGTGKTQTVLAILAVLCRRKRKELAPDAVQVKQKLLVCAPSNAAIDEIAARVLTQGLPSLGQTKEDRVFPACVRVGHPKRITRSEVLKISLSENVRKEGTKAEQTKKSDYAQQKEQLSCELDAVSAELNSLELVREAERFKAAFDEDGSWEQTHLDTTQRHTALIMKKRTLQAQLARMRERLEKELTTTKAVCQDTTLQQADIVFSTLSGAAAECLTSIEFECVIVDEAAQAVELSTLIPLCLEPSRFILIGDPQQLPATVLSRTAKRLCYERSLFQRLQLCGVQVKMLSVQYRMHPHIAQFPAAYFYNNQLINAESVTSRPPLPCHSWTGLFQPFLFFDVPSQQKRCSMSQSLSNKEEALFILTLLRLLKKHFPFSLASTNSQSAREDSASTKVRALNWSDIAIVTPYKQQVVEIRRLFDHCRNEFPEHQPEVCTIDAFQGREKRIIVFSCVRAEFTAATRYKTFSADQESASSVTSSDDDNADSGETQDGNCTQQAVQAALGFVADVRRMNVAITRARDCLWVVGNAATLRANPGWNAFIRYARGRSIRSAASTAAHGDSSFSRVGGFVNVCAHAHRLQAALRPQHLRRNLGSGVPTTTIISTFFALAEEHHLSKLSQKKQEKQKGTHFSKSTALNAQQISGNCSEVALAVQRAGQRERALSSCSSVTSSCSDPKSSSDDNASCANVSAATQQQARGQSSAVINNGSLLKSAQPAMIRAKSSCPSTVPPRIPVCALSYNSPAVNVSPKMPLVTAVRSGQHPSVQPAARKTSVLARPPISQTSTVSNSPPSMIQRQKKRIRESSHCFSTQSLKAPPYETSPRYRIAKKVFAHSSVSNNTAGLVETHLPKQRAAVFIPAHKAVSPPRIPRANSGNTTGLRTMALPNASLKPKEAVRPWRLDKSVALDSCNPVAPSLESRRFN